LYACLLFGRFRYWNYYFIYCMALNFFSKLKKNCFFLKLLQARYREEVEIHKEERKKKNIFHNKLVFCSGKCASVWVLCCTTQKYFMIILWSKNSFKFNQLKHTDTVEYLCACVLQHMIWKNVLNTHTHTTYSNIKKKWFFLSYSQKRKITKTHFFCCLKAFCVFVASTGYYSRATSWTRRRP
jgi:hypothetical protein